MKVSQIVKICGEMINLGLPDELFDEGVSGSVAGQNPDVKVLINCCNFVLEELYRDYATSLRKTVAQAVEGFVDTSQYKLCKVISLVDAEGNDVKFRYGDGGLYVDKDGKYNLCYARLPNAVEWEDEIVMPSPRVTERMLIYGVIREYFASQGDWSSAKQWDVRFKDALMVSQVKVSSMRLPVGRWW